MVKRREIIKMKKTKLVLIIGSMCLLCGCGKAKYGYNDVAQAVKDGSYSIETDTHKVQNDSPTEAIFVDTATSSDSAIYPWVIETKAFDEITDEGITKILDKIENFTCTMYIGYRVEDKNIRYAFVGANNETKNILVYAIYNTENKTLSVVPGDYENDLFDIMGH